MTSQEALLYANRMLAEHEKTFGPFEREQGWHFVVAILLSVINDKNAEIRRARRAECTFN